MSRYTYLRFENRGDDLDPRNPDAWMIAPGCLLYLFGAVTAAWEFVLKPVFLPLLP